MHNPHRLITADFRRTASILRLYEKQRVSLANNLFKLTEFPRNKSWGMHLPDNHPDVIYFRTLFDQMHHAEDDQIGTLTEMYNRSPLSGWTAQFKGLGPGKLVARFLGEIGDPYLRTQKEGVDLETPEPRTLPQLKALCGRSVINGAMPRHTAGEQSSFNGKARTRLWLITDQLIKQHDPTFHPIFMEQQERYMREQYRGIGKNGEPWSDERLAVVARKRARVQVDVAFLEGLYKEAKRLHEEASPGEFIDEDGKPMQDDPDKLADFLYEKAMRLQEEGLLEDS